MTVSVITAIIKFLWVSIVYYTKNFVLNQLFKTPTLFKYREKQTHKIIHWEEKDNTQKNISEKDTPKDDTDIRGANDW